MQTFSKNFKIGELLQCFRGRMWTLAISLRHRISPNSWGIKFSSYILPISIYKNLRNFHPHNFFRNRCCFRDIRFSDLPFVAFRNITIANEFCSMSYILKSFCFQAKVKWLDYNSKQAAGVVRTPPKFHDFPEKWPIRKNETPIPSYSRSVELTLSLDVLG